MTPPVTTAQRLPGARAVVTGGARGIGGAIAERFAAEGARVEILDRLADGGRERAERIRGCFHEVDLAEPGPAAAAVEDAIAHLGGCDVLVNVAGVFELVPLLAITVEAWDRMFAVNVRAMLVTMQTVAPHMMAGGGGAIVNLASMAAKAGGANEAHYAASKAAVVALTRAAAQEWGPHGIRANSICPGYVPTQMGAEHRTEEQLRAWTARSPLGRLGAPEDVAAAAAFLASADAGYLTGQSINVTGGMITH